MAELSVQNVTLGYEGRPVVEGLSFTVGSGDYSTSSAKTGRANRPSSKQSSASIRRWRGRSAGKA